MTCGRCGARTTTGDQLCASCRRQEHLAGLGQECQYGWADEDESEGEEVSDDGE